jgi:hypothetical protein
MELETERLNEIMTVLRYRSWHFVGTIRIKDDLFQCWLWYCGQVFCLSYGKEWDAVVVALPGKTAGVWDGVLTGELRAGQAAE